MMRLYYQPNTADGEETLLPEDGLLSELSTGSVSNNTVHSSYITEENKHSKQAIYGTLWWPNAQYAKIEYYLNNRNWVTTMFNSCMN